MAHYADVLADKEYWEEYHRNSRDLKAMANMIEEIKPVGQKFDNVKWIMDNWNKILRMKEIINLLR